MEHILTVGDNTNHGNIISFEIIDNDMYAKCSRGFFNIKELSVLPTPTPQEQDKPVLHISDDGKEMREGDYEAIVDLSSFALIELKSTKIFNEDFRKDNKLFSTKEAAEQFILENKPCFSLNDLNMNKNSICYKYMEEKARVKQFKNV